MRLNLELVQQLLDNPIKIQYMLFPEVDGDRACMEVCLAINRFNYKDLASFGNSKYHAKVYMST